MSTKNKDKKLRSGIRKVKLTLEDVKKDILKNRPKWQKSINLINKYKKLDKNNKPTKTRRIN